MENNSRKISVYDLFPVMLEMMEQGQEVAFTVNGMSMWPFLAQNRDKVILASCTKDTVKVGTIVLVQTPLGNYLLHRITEKKEDSFETTGDGNCFRDGFFPYTCLKAEAVRLERKGKTIDCSSPYWKLVFRFWMFCYPVRKYLLKTLLWVGHLKAKIR